jgi:DNA-binding response OmpR family regulator
LDFAAGSWAATPMIERSRFAAFKDRPLTLHQERRSMLEDEMRVLVAEDRKGLADTVARGLRNEGMAVDVAYDGLQASLLAAANRYDVVILDRDLPRIHGDDVCRELAGGTTRILMLTASGTIDERVAGLNLGADDYLPKPFAFAELVARTRALARRSEPAKPPLLTRAGVTLDPASRRAVRGGRELRLSPKEFAVLELLLGAAGAVVSAEDLLERAWDEDTNPLTNSVHVTVSTLRRKLGDPPLIETVPLAGYRI